MKDNLIKTVFGSVCAVLALVSAVILIAISVGGEKTVKDNGWYLKTESGKITLYKGDKSVQVFDGISVDELPEEDLKLLKNGIKFPSEEKARRAAEDYDG